MDESVETADQAAPQEQTTTAIPVKWSRGDLIVDCSSDDSVSDFAARILDQVEVVQKGLRLKLTPGKLYMNPLNESTLLKDLVKPETTITLHATPAQEVDMLNAQSKEARVRASRGLQSSRGDIKSAAPARTRDWKQVQEESQYTFHAIQPLPYLPNPEKSKRFLERLANDPGIKASMRKHKFSVGLLTEMNPAEHTTQESRTLGLNRNRGEVIELRLRTDRYDGYRDYKVIRKTLCHELSHNVWGEHDRNFWDLTKQIEEEVERGDWKHGGHKLTSSEFYNPNDRGVDGEHFDAGGWAGGEFVLGGLEGKESTTGLTRREILARAAMRRMDQQRDTANEEEQKP